MVVLKYVSDEQKLGHLYGNLREVEKRLLRSLIANGFDVANLGRSSLEESALFDGVEGFAFPDLAGAASIYLRIRRDIGTLKGEQWEKVEWTIPTMDQIAAVSEGLSQVEQRLMVAAMARGIGLVELELLDEYEGEEWDELKSLAHKLALGIDYIETLERSMEQN